MADKRQTYTTLFRLSGQTDGKFNQTFSEAGKRISALQEQMKKYRAELDKLDAEDPNGMEFGSEADRKAYEKQYYSSYAATTRRLKDIQSQINAEERLAAKEEETWQRQEAAAAAAYAVTAAAANRVLGVVKEIYGSVVSTTAEYEHTMSKVEALSGARGAELDALNAKARELGETTVFSAIQSAEAMANMAQAGWRPVEMMNGMQGVIALAAASETDLATTTSIAADTLAGFRMQASEASRMADVLAKTASVSNTDVAALGETFKSCASLAGALGFSIEDVSVMLGLMANSGVKGSMASTATRNILQGLAGDATLTAAAFGEVQISMFNEDGTAKELSETVKELRGYFGQMTQQEALANAENLAGERGYNALMAVIGATNEQYDIMYDKIHNCTGAAQEMARVRLDNLQGDVTLLQSAWESLTLTVGEKWTPAARVAVQDLTGLVQGLSGMNGGWAVALEGVLAFVGGAAGIITVTSGVAALVKTMGFLGLSLTGPLGIAALVGGLAAALGLTVLNLRAAGDETENLDKKYRDLSKRVSETNAQLHDEKIKIGQNSAETRGMIDRFEELAEAEHRSAAQKLELVSLVDALNEKVPDLGIGYDYLSDSISGATSSLEEWYKTAHRNEENERLMSAYSSYMDLRPELASTYQGLQMEADAAKLEYEKYPAQEGPYADYLRSEWLTKQAKADEAKALWSANEQKIAHASEAYQANQFDMTPREYEDAVRKGTLPDITGGTTIENFTVEVNGANKTNEEVGNDIRDILEAIEGGTILADIQ